MKVFQDTDSTKKTKLHIKFDDNFEAFILDDILMRLKPIQLTSSEKIFRETLVRQLRETLGDPQCGKN